MLAAEIARVRERGWSYVDQELEEGLRVVGAPVRDPKGRVVAAVSVSTLASGSTREMILSEMLPAVQRAAKGSRSIWRPWHADFAGLPALTIQNL